MLYNEIVQQFQHDIFGKLTTIRSYQDKNKIWFIGKEIQEILGHTNLTQAIINAKLKADEKFILKKSENESFFEKVTKQCLVTSGTTSPSMTLISESGLYKLIFRSNKPEADEFVDWVTRVVLPAIRQAAEGKNQLNYGAYVHLEIDIQKVYSKRFNYYNQLKGGTHLIITENRNICLRHTGKTPSQIKKEAQKKAVSEGLSPSRITSGLDGIRYMNPAMSCVISLNKHLQEIGLGVDKAYEMSTSSNTLNFYRDLIDCDVIPFELFENKKSLHEKK